MVHGLGAIVSTVFKKEKHSEPVFAPSAETLSEERRDTSFSDPLEGWPVSLCAGLTSCPQSHSSLGAGKTAAGNRASWLLMTLRQLYGSSPWPRTNSRHRQPVPPHPAPLLMVLRDSRKSSPH